MPRRDEIAHRVTHAIAPILDGIAGQRPPEYRRSLRAIAAALRLEADEIEILASERFQDDPR